MSKMHKNILQFMKVLYYKIFVKKTESWYFVMAFHLIQSK